MQSSNLAGKEGEWFSTCTMACVFTITANMLAETTCTYPVASFGATYRAEEEAFQVGGKGINVARMVTRLGFDVTAVCFPGGDTGTRCMHWLRQQKLDVRTFLQQTETRAGWVVRASDVETTFLGKDRPLEIDAWQAGIAFLEEVIAPGDALAICGSVPGWSRDLAAPLASLINRVAGRTFVAIDTYGLPLLELVHLPADLVKINRDEMRTLVGDQDADVLVFLRSEQCLALPPKRWVISDGGDAVHLRDHDGRIYRINPPRVAVASAVGSGDVMLAGILVALLKNGASLPEAVAFGARLGAANASRRDVACFDLDDLPELPPAAIREL